MCVYKCSACVFFCSSSLHLSWSASFLLATSFFLCVHDCVVCFLEDFLIRFSDWRVFRVCFLLFLLVHVCGLLHFSTVATGAGPFSFVSHHSSNAVTPLVLLRHPHLSATVCMRDHTGQTSGGAGDGKMRAR